MKETAEFFFKTNGKGFNILRRKSDQFLKSNGMPDNLVSEQIMIIEELVKFSSTFGKIAFPYNQISVRINIVEKAIRIEVSKPIDETAVYHVKELDETIQFIRGFQDPFEAFQRMKAVFSSPNCNGSKGIELARIAYEGKAIVDFFVNEEYILNLSAERSLMDEHQK